MSLIKDINNFFKKKDNLLFIQVIAGVLVFLALSPELGRAGLTSLLFGGSLFGFILMAIGIVLIVIPEPTTTLTGVIMTVVGALISWGTLSSLISQFDISGKYIIIGGGILLMFFMLKGRGGRQQPIIIRQAPPVNYQTKGRY